MAAKEGLTKTVLGLDNGQRLPKTSVGFFPTSQAPLSPEAAGTGVPGWNASLLAPPQRWAKVNPSPKTVEMSACQRCRQMNQIYK